MSLPGLVKRLFLFVVEPGFQSYLSDVIELAEFVHYTHVYERDYPLIRSLYKEGLTTLEAASQLWQRKAVERTF